MSAAKSTYKGEMCSTHHSVGRRGVALSDEALKAVSTLRRSVLRLAQVHHQRALKDDPGGCLCRAATRGSKPRRTRPPADPPTSNWLN
jgi:hypothetical protein